MSPGSPVLLNSSGVWHWEVAAEEGDFSLVLHLDVQSCSFLWPRRCMVLTSSMTLVFGKYYVFSFPLPQSGGNVFPQVSGGPLHLLVFFNPAHVAKNNFFS